MFKVGFIKHMNKTDLQNRTKKFSVDIIKLIGELTLNKALNILSNQLIRSATSIGANYRSACKGKSKADFINKIIICEEEADESIYWLELMEETQLVNSDIIKPLKLEANELTAIFTAIGKTAKQNHINSKSAIRNSK